MKVEVSERSFDGKFSVWGFQADPNYDPNEKDIAPGYIPFRWVCLDVCNDKDAAHAKAGQHRNPQLN